VHLEPLDPSATLAEAVAKINEIIQVIKDQPLEIDSLGSSETDDLPGNIEDLVN